MFRARVVVLAGFMMAAATPGFAQVEVTAKGGLNLASISFDGDEDSDDDLESAKGFVAGVAVKVPLTPMLSFQPEVLASQKGVQSSFSEEGVTATFKTRITYVEIPLLLNVDIPTTSSVKPFVYAGPYVAFKASTSADFDLEGDLVDQLLDEEGLTEDELIDEFLGEVFGQDLEEFEQELDDDTKTTDMGLVFGGGVRVKNFSVEARYGLGLTDLSKGEAKAKNRVFSILFGYTFSN